MKKLTPTTEAGPAPTDDVCAFCGERCGSIGETPEIQAPTGKLYACRCSFDSWQESPYTKVLQKSIDEDYVPRGAEIQVAPVLSVLRELVACKDYMDATGMGMSLADYNRRWPLAWEAARAALSDERKQGFVNPAEASNEGKERATAAAAVQAPTEPDLMEQWEAQTWAAVVHRLLPLMCKDCDVLDDLEDFLRNRAGTKGQ